MSPNTLILRLKLRLITSYIIITGFYGAQKPGVPGFPSHQERSGQGKCLSVSQPTSVLALYLKDLRPISVDLSAADKSEPRPVQSMRTLARLINQLKYSQMQGQSALTLARLIKMAARCRYFSQSKCRELLVVQPTNLIRGKHKQKHMFVTLPPS